MSSSALLYYPNTSKPAVLPFPGFHPQIDALKLFLAINDRKINVNRIIDILTRRNFEQRLKIVAAYKNGYELIGELESKLSGNCKDMIIALLTETTELHAKLLYNSMVWDEYGNVIDGIDQDLLIEILMTFSNIAIKRIAENYIKFYGHPLIDDITTDDYHFRLIVSHLLRGKRCEMNDIDKQQAIRDAKFLVRSYETNSSDEFRAIFHYILTRRSYWQIRETMERLNEIKGHHFIRYIENLLFPTYSIVKDSCISKDKLLASSLWDSIENGGDTENIIRIIIGRSEIDLIDIKKCFKEMYGVTLQHKIAIHESGSCWKLLLTLLTI